MSKQKTFEQLMNEEIKFRKYQNEKSLYYTTQSLMGIDWWTWAWIIGARGRGKSFSVVDTMLSYKKRYGYDNVKCYYFRISDLSIKTMLENKARKAIDKLLIRKYDLDITTKANTIYDHGNHREL